MNTILTCTGDRPICLGLLIKWMQEQTVKPDQWLIIEDGKMPISEELLNAMPDYADIIRREPLNNDSKHTLNINIEAALPYIEGDKIIFMEDDEYYAPKYIETVSGYLDRHEVVGICKSRYYHLPTYKYFIHNNHDHASLAQTGISKSFLSELKTLLNGDPFIDVRLWHKIGGKISKNKVGIEGKIIGSRGFLFDDAFNDYLYLGMKGLPGRKGIGCGHQGIGKYDLNQQVFKKWLPIDNHRTMYLDLIKDRAKWNGDGK